jgi:hypothetical protein
MRSFLFIEQNLSRQWKYSLYLNEITGANNCTVNIHIRLRPIQFRRPLMITMMTSQSSIVMDIHSPPPYRGTQFIHSMCKTYTERWNVFELLSIASLPASSCRQDYWGDLDSHQNWSPYVLITGYWCRCKILVKWKSRDGWFVLMIQYWLYLEYDSSWIHSDNLTSINWTLGAGWRTGCPHAYDVLYSRNYRPLDPI